MRVEQQNDGIGLIAQLAQAALALDARGDIEFANGAAEELLGRSSSSVRGRPLFAFISARRSRRLVDAPSFAIPAAGVDTVDDATALLQVEGGGGRPVDLHLTGERDGRRYLFLRDVSEREQTYDALRADPAVVDDADPVRVGLWEWDITAGAVRWSPELFRMQGLAPGSVIPSYEAFLGFVHPDDREAVDARNRRAFVDHQPFKDIKRMVGGDGRAIEVRTQGEVVVGSDGAPIRMFGACEDVTDLRSAIRELAHVG
ncbi:MAG: PAS domain-containing protein [Patulibacter minatonensis]